MQLVTQNLPLPEAAFAAHPTPPCADGDKGAFTHMAGWAAGLGFAICSLSPGSCLRR